MNKNVSGRPQPLSKHDDKSHRLTAVVNELYWVSPHVSEPVGVIIQKK